MIEQYSKIAASICGRTVEITSPVIVATSSSKEVNVLEAATQTAVAVTELQKKVALVDVCLKGADGATVGEPKEKGNLSVYSFVADQKKESVINDKNIKGFLEKLKAEYDIILVAADPICDAKTTLLFASQSNGVILVEQRKTSRTDEIDQAVSAIETVTATPFGFILL